MTKIDAEREAFEKWFRFYICNHDFDLRRNNLGIYEEQRTAFAWRGWQAALAQQSTLSKAVQVVLNIEPVNGIKGCTWGDTKFDSESAAHGYNEAIGDAKAVLYRALAAANALPVQPKATRGELEELLMDKYLNAPADRKAFGVIQYMVDAIIAKWPHIVGE